VSGGAQRAALSWCLTALRRHRGVSDGAKRAAVSWCLMALRGLLYRGV